MISALALIMSSCVFLMVLMLNPSGGNGMPETVAAAFVYMSLGVFLIDRRKWERREKSILMIIFAFAYIVRLVAALILFPYYMKYNLSPDQATYITTAGQLAQIWGWHDNPFALLLSRVGVYGQLGMHVFLALHFKLVNAAEFFFSTNAFLGAFCIVPLYRMGKKVLAGENAERTLVTAVAVYAVFPLAVFWCTWILKEALCIFLCVMFVGKLMDYLEGKVVSSAVWMLLIIVAAATVRMYLAPIFIAVAAGAIVLYPKKSWKVAWTSVVVMAALIVFIAGTTKYLSVMPQFDFLFRASSRVLSKGTFTTLASVREEGARGPGSDIDKLSYSSPVEMVKFFPLGLLKTLTSPVQWLRKGMKLDEALSVYCIVFWHLLLPFALAGFWEWGRRYFRSGSSVAIFVVLLVLYFSLITLGGSFRQNCMLYPFFCLFAAMGLARWRSLLPFAFGCYLLIGALVAQTEYAIVTTALLLLPGAAVWAAAVLYALHVAEKGRGRAPAPPGAARHADSL